MSNTILSNPSTYDIENIIFSEPVPGCIPDSVPKIEFFRINLATKNPDGTIGDLIFGTEKLYSFGVSENKSLDSGKISGYVMPLCLWSRDGPTAAEKSFTDIFTAIVDKCKEHLVENREEIEKFDLELNDLKKFNPLYYKKEKVVDSKTGKTVLKAVEGQGPTLYAKLIYSKKNNNFTTSFFSPKDGSEVDPLSLLNKHCFTRAAIKIESIFVGQRLSLQVKVYEAEVEEKQMGSRRLLQRALPNANRLVMQSSGSASQMMTQEPADDNEGSLRGSDSEEEEAPPPPVVKKKAKKKKVRRVRKVT